ncbi:MAG: response regulator [Burkholderiales bacterium]|nr:response regulator [Burkholderiales bacterium]
MNALAPAPAPAAADWLVLCVDDEANILSALKRVLRGAGYSVVTAGDAAQALERLAEMPVDVIVSDMRMPGMDGAALLEQVHRRWPGIARLLLTGHAEMSATVAAINRGRIFRYLQKPWDEHELLGALAEATERLALEREKARLEALTREQNEKLTAFNRELEQRVADRTAELKGANDRLQRNYLKTIKVFSNLIELRGGQTAGHCRRVADSARDIARKMGLPEEQTLQVFVAALLHDIGMIALPDRIIGRPVKRLADDELALYRAHPLGAENSLMALDELQPLMPMIRSHHERHDGLGFPDKLSGAAIALGARIIAVADTFDALQHGTLVDAKLSVAEARTLMREGRGSQFDPEVLDVFLHLTEPERPRRPTDLKLGSAALEPDMLLSRDLVSPTGLLMLSAGHRLTPSLIRRIREFEPRSGPLEIFVKPERAA